MAGHRVFTHSVGVRPAQEWAAAASGCASALCHPSRRTLEIDAASALRPARIPIRPPTVAATDDGRWAPGLAAGVGHGNAPEINTASECAPAPSDSRRRRGSPHRLARRRQLRVLRVGADSAGGIAFTVAMPTRGMLSLDTPAKRSRLRKLLEWSESYSLESAVQASSCGPN